MADPRFRELLEATRSTGIRQRRFLRYRLLLWCLPWAPPLPFGLVLPLVLVKQGPPGLIGALALVVSGLLVLGLLDHQLRIDSGEIPAPVNPQGPALRGALRFTAVQLLIIAALFGLFRVNDMVDSRLPREYYQRWQHYPPDRPPVKRTMLRTF